MSAVTAVALSWSIARELSSAQTVALARFLRSAIALPGREISLQTSSHQSTNSASLYSPAYGLAPIVTVSTRSTGSMSRTRRK